MYQPTQNMTTDCTQLVIRRDNMLPYFGLFYARMSASDKEQPVIKSYLKEAIAIHNFPNFIDKGLFLKVIKSDFLTFLQ